MAEKNPPYPPVSDDHGSWPASREQATVGGDILPYDEGLPTIFELIPRRGQPLGMLLTGMAAVALLLAGYRGFGASPPAWVPTPLSAFGLEGPGNLASWFSSLVLTTAALYALVIWWILHWLYRQKAHVWLVAAMCWFLMGMDESAGLHLAFARFLGEFLGSSSNSPLWWLIPYGIVCAGIVSRLLVDLKQSWGALLWMSLAMGAYFFSALVQAGWNVASPLGWEPVMAEELGELIGHWFLLMANVSFAAYLVRDIVDDNPDETGRTLRSTHSSAPAAETQGKGPRRGSTSGPPVGEEPLAGSGDVLIIHPPHGYGPPRAVRRIVRSGRKAASPAKTARRRSDLDLPARRTSRKAAASSPPSAAPLVDTTDVRPQPMLEEQGPSNTAGPRPAAMNAFLAGMAYAEAQNAAQSMTIASPSSLPSSLESQTEATSNLANPPSRTGTTYPVQQVSASPSSRNFGYTDQVGQTGIGNPHPSSTTPQANFGGSGQTLASRYVAGPNQSQSISPGSMGGQAPTPTPTAPVQLPARKLTKEEKKRLKQLYKQRLAQQTQ